MKKTIAGSLILAALFAGTAIAHEGVQNEAVKARMAGMSAIGDAMKTLGGMAKGAIAFDAKAANAALATVAAEAARTPALFEPQEDDPKSEALPAIWTNWDDFVAKAAALEAAAAGPVTAETLGAKMGALGGSCKACHSAYRE